MGLFSRHKTSVFSATLPLAEANPNSVKQVVLSAILNNNSIADSLSANRLHSIDTTIVNMRKYAKESYVLGLPSTQLYDDIVIFDPVDVEEAISDDTNAAYGVLTDFTMVVPLELHHITYPYLSTVRGLINGDDITIFPEEWGTPLPEPRDGWKIETVVKFIDAVLNDVGNTINISYGASVNYYRHTSDRVNIGGTGGADSADPAKWVYKTVKHIDPVASYVYEESIATPLDMCLGYDYCIAQYSIIGVDGLIGETTHFWYYDVSTEKYPKLTIKNDIEEENNLFPVIPIRWDNQDLTREEVQETELYQTSKKLLKKISININDLSLALNESPDIEEIDHAYVMFGVNLQTENTASIKYLIAFFDHLADQASISNYNQLINTINKEFPPQNNFWKIKGIGGTEHTLEEYGLDIDIRFKDVRSEISIENIGEIGTVSTEKKYLPYSLSDGSYLMSPKVRNCNSQLILKLQITDALCKRIIVSGLTHRNYIYKDRVITTDLDDLIDDPENNNFVIPLHYGVSKTLPVFDRQQIYTESIMIVVNSIVRTKLSWYQTGAFKFIVAVIITFASSGYLSAVVGNIVKLGLGAAAAGGSAYWAVLQYILPKIIWGAIISYGLNVLGNLLGPNFTAILAIVTIVVSVYTGYYGKTFSLLSCKITAIDMLRAANGLITSVGKQLQAMIGDLSAAYDEFLVDVEKKQKLLEEAQSLLDVPDIYAFDLLKSQTRKKIINLSATPTEFFDLKIHAGNIGTLVLDSAKYYHDIALSLPKPDSIINRNRAITV